MILGNEIQEWSYNTRVSCANSALGDLFSNFSLYSDEDRMAFILMAGEFASSGICDEEERFLKCLSYYTGSGGTSKLNSVENSNSGVNNAIEMAEMMKSASAGMLEQFAILVGGIICADEDESFVYCNRAIRSIYDRSGFDIIITELKKKLRSSSSSSSSKSSSSSSYSSSSSSSYSSVTVWDVKDIIYNTRFAVKDAISDDFGWQADIEAFDMTSEWSTDSVVVSVTLRLDSSVSTYNLTNRVLNAATNAIKRVASEYQVQLKKCNVKVSVKYHQ